MNKKELKVLRDLANEAWGALAWLDGSIQLSDHARMYKIEKLRTALAIAEEHIAEGDMKIAKSPSLQAERLEKDLVRLDNARLVAQTNRLFRENGDLSKENALLRKENAGLENDNKGLRFRMAFLEPNGETPRTKIENLED